MIFYLVTERGRGTTAYVTSWGPGPESRMRYLTYNSLRETRELERATYLFTDHERLAPPELELARRLWRTLSDARPPLRLLNDPFRVLGRLDLLTLLADQGINRFRGVRASAPSDVLASLRYPVFVREEAAHTGPLTPLIEDVDALVRTLRRLRARGYYRRDLLVVEFCDTADGSGVIRKYAAFFVGNKVLPRHVLFGRDWILKTTELEGPAFDAERDEYLKANPHATEIARIFELARIDFGRIDYGLLDGKPQVWEINTNPTVRTVTWHLTHFFEGLDDVAPGRSIPWSVDPELDRALRTARRKRFLTQQHRAIAARLLR